MNKQLVIFGAWFFSDVVEELANILGWTVIGRVDPNPPADLPTLARLPSGARCFVAIGDVHVRAFVSHQLILAGRQLVTLIHPRAAVSDHARIEPGCYIGECAVVRTGAVIGCGSHVNSGAVVSHHVSLGNYTLLGPNAATTGRSSVGDLSLIGAGASITPCCAIGERVTVGAGSVVIRDIPDNSVVAGNPARAIATSVGNQAVCRRVVRRRHGDIQTQANHSLPTTISDHGKSGLC